jgi:hypothetical protein
MMKTFRGIQIFLMIAISLCILALAGYLRYTQLSQYKFVSADASLENPDPEQELPDNEKELKVDGSSALSIMFHLGTHLFDQPFLLFFQTLSLRQVTFVLRC